MASDEPPPPAGNTEGRSAAVGGEQAAAGRDYDEFAPLYDLFYTERQPEIDFYCSLLRPQDRSVLELGCGTGTIVGAIAHALAGRHGTSWRAVGLDRSSAMLQRARAKYPHIEWLDGDMTTPPVTGPFDLIVCAFNTLQMLDTDAAVVQMLASARDLLGPAGQIAIDVYNASCLEAPQSADARTGRLVKRLADPDGRDLEVIEDSIDDETGDSVLLDWRVVDPVAARQRARLVVRLRHYPPAVLEHLVELAGFRIRERYGDVRRSAFVPTLSSKQVLVCSR